MEHDQNHVVVHVGPAAKASEKVTVDGDDWTSHIAGMTIEMWPNEPPRVTITLDSKMIDVDLYGRVDYPLADVLRSVLARAEQDQPFAEQIESAAAHMMPKGLGGAKGDMTVGFLRGLIDAIDDTAV